VKTRPMDLASTLAELAGIPYPDELDGKALLSGPEGGGPNCSDLKRSRLDKASQEPDPASHGCLPTSVLSWGR
jgi:hypothetical protein